MTLQNLVLNVVEFLYCAIDIMLLHYCCSLFLDKKEQKSYHIVVYVASVFGIFLATNDVVYSSFATLVSILIMLIYAFMIFEGKPYRVSLSVGLYFIGSGIVTLFTATLIPILFKTDILTIMTNPINRSGIVLLTKLLILLLEYLYDVKYRFSANGLLNIRSMLLFFVVSFNILILLFEFAYLSNAIAVEKLVIIMTLTFILLVVIITILTMKYIREREKSIMVELQLKETELKNKEYIRIANEQIELMRVKHDLKNHLIVLDTYIRQNNNDTALDYLKKLLIHPALKTYVDTRNEVLNAILNHKISEFSNIHFKVRYDNGYYDIESDKLTIIMGNALDNAIEAVNGLKDAEIKIVLSENEEYIKIFISNPYVNNPVVHNGKLVSNKDTRFSGFGMTNMIQAADSINGNAIYEIDEDTFKFIVIIDKQLNQ